MKIPVQRLTPKDIAKTPEEFEKIYQLREERGKRSRPVPERKLEDDKRMNMSEALERFGLGES